MYSLGMANSYRDLQVWQSSIDLAERIYRLTSTFPKSELYGLTSQLRRASVSVPSNIAEGWARRSRKDYQRFVEIALGSNDELQTQLVIADRLGLAEKTLLAETVALSDQVGRMLQGLRKFLERPTPST
jgi:four helix bundle protein